MTPSRRRLTTLITLMALVAPAMATDWFVSPTGSDSATGRAVTAPFKTIQRAVDVAVPGDTVRVRAGTYTETVSVANKVGAATRPLVIAAYGSEKPVISGAQRVTGWTLVAGSTWKKTGWPYPSQTVFDDGATMTRIGPVPSFYSGIAADGSWMLQPIGTGVASMTAGSFYYDAVARTLYVKLKDGGNPNGHAIEAGTARKLVTTTGSSYVTLRGLTFRYSNSSAYEQMGAAIDLGTGCRMEACDVQWCDFAGIGMTWQTGGQQIVDCIVSNNGDCGIQGGRISNFTISGCTIDGNKWRPFNGAWHGGGVKVTSNSYGSVTGNRITNNQAAGTWWDFCASGQRLVIDRNYVAGNKLRTGAIDLEGSKNAVVSNNVVVDNEIRGIYISASDDVKVYNNTIVGTRSFAGIDVGGMPRSGKTLTNVSVCNNILCNNTSTDDIRLLKDNGGDIRNISSDNNVIFRANGAVSLWWGRDSRGGWSGTRCTSLAQWRAATPFDDHSTQANPQFLVGSGENFACASTSPAVNRGRALTEVKADFRGMLRPVGGIADIGAYER